MKYEHCFPLGISREHSFIGREEEQEWIAGNVKAKVHTLLTGQRRYGKSSLVLHTLNAKNIDFIEIDLQLCPSPRSMEENILCSIEKLINGLFDNKDKVISSIKYFLQKQNKLWEITLQKQTGISIEPNHHYNVAENILTLFQILEELLSINNKQAVIFIDEVQKIIQLENSIEIQGAIRHFAQKTQHISFIFSGSNRRLIKQMFGDQSMPLYQLCDTIKIDRISEKQYKNYIQSVAKSTLDINLSDEVLQKIVDLTQCHPRRTNHLCLHLWRFIEHSEESPTSQHVQAVWNKVVSSEAQTIRSSLTKITNQQMQVLSNLVNQDITHNTLPSLKQYAEDLQELEEKDIIEQLTENQYRVIDPVMINVIRNTESALAS